MPNTFPRMYLNSKLISSLVVRSNVIPREDAIYMVPRTFQKLGGDSSVVSIVATLLWIVSLIPMCLIS